MSMNNMSGGASMPSVHITLFDNLDTIPHMIYGFLVIILIVFVDKVPSHVGRYVDTALGRILGIAGIGLCLHFVGWTYALLTAIAFLLLVHISNRQQTEILPMNTAIDGFENLEKRQTQGNRWFVETVLGEYPEAIESDNVTTNAVQDLSNRSMSSSRSK
jgi:hypothetical protein